jgi:enediyne biosynthesis protein E4
VQVIRSAGPTLWRRARADGSYASASDPRLIVGLGAPTDPPRLKITWPSGRVESFDSVPIDRYSTIKEGSGQ